MVNQIRAQKLGLFVGRTSSILMHANQLLGSGIIGCRGRGIF